MKNTILITALALTATCFGQEDVVDQPWSGGTSESRFFIGGSYGFSSEGAFSVTSNSTPDGINVDQLGSVEFGMKRKWDQLTFVLSAELLFGEGSDSGIDSFGDTVSYESENFGGLINAKIEFQPSEFISLYAGVGIGALDNTFELSDSSLSNTITAEESVLIWQVTAGVELKPIDQIGIFVQYRYLTGEDFEGTDFTSINDSFVDVGARFYF